MSRSVNSVLISKAAIVVVLASLIAFPSFAATDIENTLPPTQGAPLQSMEAALSQFRILGSSQGLSLVSYQISAVLNAGISHLVGIGADSGMIDGSLNIGLVEGECSIEETTIGYEGGMPASINLKVLSKEGGAATFEVVYLTRSVGWEVTGNMVTAPGMLLDGEIYLDISNSGSLRYSDVEFLLFGSGGSISSINGPIYGTELWSALQPVGQSLDIPAGSKLRIPLSNFEGIVYRTFVGGTIGSGLKGYMGKAAVKEQIKLDIYLETASSSALVGIPAKPVKLTVYFQDSIFGLMPVKWIDSPNIALNKGALALKLDSASGITAEIEKTESKTVGSSSFEESFRIILKSSSPYPTEVQLIESYPGEWELISNTGAEWQRIDGNSAIIKITVPAKGTQIQMYKVRYTYSR